MGLLGERYSWLYGKIVKEPSCEAGSRVGSLSAGWQRGPRFYEVFRQLALKQENPGWPGRGWDQLVEVDYAMASIRLLPFVWGVSLLGICFLFSSASNQAQDPTSSDWDGHPDVTLLDEAGNPVDPTAPSPAPYSPKQTCGQCHDYDAITAAYHFQMGADRISDDYGTKQGRPWVSSDGQFGRQFHMSYEWLGKKKNGSAAEVGLSAYQFELSCGKCHPGGGLAELDRNGNRMDKHQAANPGIAASFDGDYFAAEWVKSGVVEADCLICHQPKYDFAGRWQQLSQGNFRWAASVGARLATVEGSVLAGQTPKLRYQGVAKDGTVRLQIGRVTDANCLLCHGEAEVKKRGHVWDGRNEDIHSSRGMKCTSCHVTGADHQIRKGRSNEVTLRDDLDDPTLSCESCHARGELGAKKPQHPSTPPSHLKSIACVTCHVRDQNVTAVLAVDTTTGAAIGVPTHPEAKKYGESFEWSMSLFRLADGRIYAGNALLPVWWGHRDGDIIYPLTLAETKAAYLRAQAAIKDDNGDGKPEANTESEILAMLEALRSTLSGGRFSRPNPVYVKGHTVYAETAGKVTKSEHRQAQPLRWTFSHNVAAASRALGAQGCKDCHTTPHSRFLHAPIVLDPYDENGKRSTIQMWKHLKIDETVITAGQ